MAASEKIEKRQPKRKDYLAWDDFFLSVSVLSSKRSKDPTSPSGACIVDEKNRIVGIGYRGFPKGCSDDIFPWQEFGESSEAEWLHTNAPYVCQAAMNAILNKCSDDVGGCRIYMMEFPDCDSAKVIIQSGIVEVVVLGDNIFENEKDPRDNALPDEIKAARMLLDMAGVKVRFYKPDASIVSLEFESDESRNELGCHTKTDHNYKSQQREAERDLARRLLLEEAGYDASKIPNRKEKRESISWEDYFMAMAFLAAQRSKDPNTQVGACIVDPCYRIVGLGYNGFPSGCSDDLLPWARSNQDPLDNKYLYVCHAEVNAILNKGSANVKGATLYVALFPCEGCAKMIIQAGIQEVVFMRDAYHNTPGCRASRIMLKCAGIKLRQYVPTMRRLELVMDRFTL